MIERAMNRILGSRNATNWWCISTIVVALLGAAGAGLTSNGLIEVILVISSASLALTSVLLYIKQDDAFDKAEASQMAIFMEARRMSKFSQIIGWTSVLGNRRRTV